MPFVNQFSGHARAYASHPPTYPDALCAAIAGLAPHRRMVLALWLYQLAETEPNVDALLRRFHDDVVGPGWLAGRRLVEEGYAGVELPFPEVVMPAFVAEAGFTLAAYLGYVDTWSAVARFRRETGADPLPAFREELRQVWGPEDKVRVVRWPIHLRVAVKA